MMIFLNLAPKGAETKISKWDYIKLKSFYTERKPTNEKAAYGIGENICKSYTY